MRRIQKYNFQMWTKDQWLVVVWSHTRNYIDAEEESPVN